MKTIVGHINALDTRHTPFLHHLVIFQLGRRYACEQLLAGTAPESILTTLFLKFLPSKLYTRSMLQQAISLVKAPRETIQAYGYYLSEAIQPQASESPFFKWWQDEAGFFDQLQQQGPRFFPQAEQCLQTRLTGSIFTVRFQDDGLVLHMPVYDTRHKDFSPWAAPIQLDADSLAYLKRQLYQQADLKLSVELVWCGPEIYILITAAAEGSSSDTPNRLQGEWRWVRSPVTKVATATILTLQGMAFSAGAAPGPEPVLLAENPLLPKKVIPPSKTPTPVKVKAVEPTPHSHPTLPKATVRPPSPPPAKPVTPAAKPHRPQTAPQRVTPRHTPVRYQRPQRRYSRPQTARRRWVPTTHDRPGATYVVSQGETLVSIAQNILGNSALWTNIYALNRTHIANPNWIRTGQRIVLPSRSANLRPAPLYRYAVKPVTHYQRRPYAGYAASGRAYRVRYGDSLWKIASHSLGNPYRWPLIYRMNRHKLQDPNIIYPGQRLILPLA